MATLEVSIPETLKLQLDTIEVPAGFARYENITEDHVIVRLDEWKHNAHRVLTQIRHILEQDASNLSLQEQADIISATAVFDGDGPWITPVSRDVSRDILGRFSEPNSPLLGQILSHNIKPLFRSNPHPSLNMTTGRKLNRPAGGPMASQDYYEAQTWKDHPGSSNLVSWCVRRVQRHNYEDLWHLIIPPIMTLLDDYEASYKLRGVQIVSEMLEHVPKNLLKRTGVDGLIRSSLNTCLSHLQSPETPQLLESAISASLSLTLLTTLPGSSDRFDQLCALLGEGIIGGVWLYASEKPDVILASIDALPPVVMALGIGVARYLKALMSQLVHPLLLNGFNPSAVELQISSLKVLATVIDECAPCISHWKGTILDGIGRCWVNMLDAEGDGRECGVPVAQEHLMRQFPRDLADPELRRQLRQTCERLAISCPSVVEEEFKRFLSSDLGMFGDLFNRVPTI